MDDNKCCNICGRPLPESNFYNHCPACHEQYVKELNSICEYLFLHPGAKIFEVSTNLDIAIHKIKMFLQDGRIEIVEKNHSFLTCEVCKVPIHSGRLCDKCLAQKNSEAMLNASAKGNKASTQIRFTDYSGKRKYNAV